MSAEVAAAGSAGAAPRLGAKAPHAGVVQALGNRPARMLPLPLDPLAVERGPELVGRAAVGFVGVAGAHDRRIQPDQRRLLLLMIRSARPTQSRPRWHAPPLKPASCRPTPQASHSPAVDWCDLPQCLVGRATRGSGSGRPGDRKNVTQAPDRGRHPRGCRPRRRFLTVRSGRRFSTCGESRPRVVLVQVENLHPREGNEPQVCRSGRRFSTCGIHDRVYFPCRPSSCTRSSRAPAQWRDT